MPSFEAAGFTGIRLKILIVFLLVLIVPLAVLMLVSVRRASEAAQQDFSRRLEFSAGLFRENLEEQLERMKLRVKTVADFDFLEPAAEGFLPERIGQLLELELIRSGLDYISIVKNRVELVSSHGNLSREAVARLVPAICHSPLSSNLFILENEPWIFAAAEITKLRLKDRHHVVFAFRMSRDFGDKLKQITGAEFSLLYANRRILSTMIDIFGKRMAGTSPLNPAHKMGTIEVRGEAYMFVREELLKGKVSDAIILEIALPGSDITTLGDKIAADFKLLGFLGILLAVITGSILSYNFATPLKKLAESTTLIAEGRYDIQIESDRNDEIGLLTRNFDSMIRSLKVERDLKNSRMKELQTLFGISNAVNFITDSEELLKYVLTHSIEVLGAERGSIMLLDDQTDELIVKVAFGGRYRLVTGTPVKLGTGVCGLVAREGVGRICNTGFRDQEFRNFGSLLPVEDIKTLLCSPLKFKEGIIGVVNIVNKKDGAEFNENDLALLNVITSQAAITIENNKLYELSITDGLTRLFVHRYFQARLSEELLRARRYGLQLSLIMIDIDNFKNFNDVYGHQVGDQVLQKVSLAIRDTIRTGIDIPCRYGGEELSVILPETRTEESFNTAERLRESIAAIRISHPMGELNVTASLGVASYPNDSHDRESLVSTADRALYYSKNHGKNRTTNASAITDEA